MRLLKYTPSLTPEQARSLAREFYGLQATATALPSERDQNFLLETESGGKFVLKIANSLEDRSLVEAQNGALSHLARRVAFVPRVVPTAADESIARFDSAGPSNFVRLLTYLPGTPLANSQFHSTELLHDLGSKLGQVDRALASFDHSAIHRDFHWDLANGPKVIREFAALVEDEEMKRSISDFGIAYERRVARMLATLPRSTIHNDANDYNVLVSESAGDQRVVGLIDFGDLVHSFTGGDLAVAIAYAILNKRDPLAAAAPIVAGYYSQRRLETGEIAVLFDWVRLRLCMSVCLHAEQQRERPDNNYLSISQRSVREALPRLFRIPSADAEAVFRRACGIPDALVVADPRSQAETLAARRRWLGSNLSLAYTNPLKIARGSMQYLYDEAGRKYLDAYNNVPHVGHCHPRVVRVGQEQMALLNTNTRYLHDLVNVYAERLSSLLPERLKVCYFVNSGSEANELALRLARAHTGQQDMIVLEHAYHGNTTTLIDISPYKHNGPGGAGAPAWVHTAPIPDLYRGRYKSDDRNAAEHYAQHVLEIIDGLQAANLGLAGFIAETFPSVAGQIVLPEGYLARVYEAVRAARGVLIADEVQTGYGRIGTHFWGFEASGVVPDIVVLGKSIGNGHPIGAVVTTPEIAASFDNGMEFFSTFGGNTVSSAIGLAVLEVVVEEELQPHGLRVGKALLAALNKLKDRYSIIGDVRGSGLFIGIELVRNRETLEPAAPEASLVVNRLREEGVLLGTDGPFHNVIKIRPPMPFNEADADLLVTTLEKILKENFG